MSKTQYNVVWYWSGGRESGYWTGARPHTITSEAVDVLVSEIERGGRVAIRGTRSIGAPEGRPAEARFEAIGMGKKSRFYSTTNTNQGETP